MKRAFIAAAAAAVIAPTALLAAPVDNAYAQPPAQGDQCWNWHATMQDSNGQTLTCTHLSDSGHMMYWEYGGAQDIGFKTDSSGGFKTDPNTDPNSPYGHNGPCDSRNVHVSHIDPQTGNAIEVWGPPGCDPSLPMTGNN
jgi:hypothetical protein